MKECKAVQRKNFGLTIIVAVMVLFLAVGVSAGVDSNKWVLVEAESFDDTGGWVVDSQFMDQMGSPFLLAHGLGRPVDDAETRVKFPKTGKYRVWVRTRDWVGPWKTPETPKTKRAYGTPGKFQVLIDGKFLQTIFGTKGGQWHWHDGGVIEITKREVRLALHDLTGFEGRCDAILFSQDHDFIPPSSLEELTAFRRKLRGTEKVYDSGEYDLVVAGGGIAGTCAAISAARNGLNVALIQDRPVLGGNNSSEVRVWLNGATNGSKYPRIGDVVRQLEPKKRKHYGPENTADLYEDDKREKLVRAERISLFLNHRANGVKMDGRRIVSVIAENVESGKRYSFKGKWFADCTGDGCIGFMAGADFDITLKGHMGRCNLWNVKDTGKPVAFPHCQWALDLTKKPFPGRGNIRGKYPSGINALGGWYWESGFDRDPIKEREYIRDWNFRAMYGAWDALKNVDKVLPNHKLNWSGHISGPRESRRLLGPVIVTKKALQAKHVWDDGCVVTGWKIDVHHPKPEYSKGFEGDAFISYAAYDTYPMPAWLPYRMLYSRNTDNLFMGGRCVSVTHEALGTSRVMRTGGLMGEVVGLAATLCKEKGCDPKDVYEKHLITFKELLKRGVTPSGKVNKHGVSADLVTGTDVEGDMKLVVSPFCKSLRAGNRILEEKDWRNWDMAPIYGPDGGVHLFVGRWPVKGSWLKNARIDHYKAEKPEGPYQHVETVFAKEGVTYFNPQINKVDDLYVMVYSYKKAKTPNVQQQIGLATSKSLSGPWKQSSHNPIIYPSLKSGTANCLHASNPTFVKTPDGKYRIYYKSMSDKYPKPYMRTISMAVADNIEGPYENYSGNPLISYADHGLDIEDPYAFYYNDKYYMILEDRMGVAGLLTGKEKPKVIKKGGSRGGLIYKSEDGISWGRPEVGYLSNSSYFNEETHRFERPHILWKDGQLDYLFLALNKGKYNTSSGAILKIEK